MSKYNIESIWCKFYKTSPNYQAAIKRFEDGSLSDLVAYYNSTYSQYVKSDVLEDMAESIYCYGFSEHEPTQDETQAHSYLTELMYFGLKEEGQWIIGPRDFEILLGVIVPLSFAASKYSPDYFYPYLFALRFPDFISILNVLDINIPEIPKRTEYERRFEYYWTFCRILGEIRNRFHLSHTETCVFIYDFLPSITEEEKATLPEATQCWFIGGRICKEDVHGDKSIWQVNKDTRPGDILVHYETSPISAVTTIWRAQSNGCTDPFFRFNTYAVIGNRLDVPHISLHELKQDEYFSRFPLTKKNSQGVNGFRMNAEAYAELQRIFSAKGFDTTNLPQLFAPRISNHPNIHNEHDVEEHLIIPLLESAGLVYGRDYKRQMGIHVGTGHRVFPDFVIDFNDDQESARIIIEAKLQMKNRAEIERAFMQARSYALNLKSDIIMLCDECQLLIYTKTDSDFKKEDCKLISWAQVESPDTFNWLKKTLLNL